MPSPITPNNLKDKLPNMDAPTVCDRLKRVLVDFPKQVYEFVAYIWDEDGNLTESFKDDVCAIDCVSVDETVDPKPGSGSSGGGVIKKPILKTIAGLRHDGGIPIIWNHVTNATHYDIYRYKPTDSKPTLTDAEVPTLATRLRKDISPSGGGIQSGPLPNVGEGTTSDGYLYHRKQDNTCLYVDINGGPIYDGKGGIDFTGSQVDSQTLYHYWVVGRNLDTDQTITGALSNYVKAFAKYPTGYSSSGNSDELLWSGNEETVPSGKAHMRVVLRGGGGAGGGGGDYVVQTYNSPFIKNLNDDGTETTFETYTDHGFSRGDQLRLTESIDSNGGTSWEGIYIVSEYINSKTVKIKGSDYVAHSVSAARTTFTPTGQSVASYGKLNKTSDEVALDIPGAGGGGGALLVASFNILNSSTDGTNGVSKVRCRTLDSAGALVDYAARSQTTDFMSGTDHLSQVLPFNRGGEGRENAATEPKAGEPHASDSNSTNNGSGSGYVTVLEIFTSSNNWQEVARVSHGKGGGYKDVTSDFTGRGGDGGVKLGAASTTNRSVGATGVCTLNTGAKLGTASAVGKLEYAGTAGTDSTSGKRGTSVSGDAGVGGYIWDSAKPSFNTSGQSESRKFGRPSNGFDLGAPGSGGSGSIGSTEENIAPYAKGGHAFGGAAWITYSSTAQNDY